MFLTVFDSIQDQYKGTVDGQIHEKIVLLCPETSDFLYSQFTPSQVQYQSNSRPLLEAKVMEITAEAVTDRDRVLALLRYVRDLYKQSPIIPKSPLLGGTEEQLMATSPRRCEFQSRILTALSQVAGYPSRRVAHFIGGHAVTEIFFEGKWAYLDIRGIYFLKPDGKFASTWEIWNNPELIENQNDNVKSDRVSENEPELSKIYLWKNTPNRYFNPNEVTAIMNYDISQSTKYSFRQLDPQRFTQRPRQREFLQTLETWRRFIFAKIL